MNTKPYRPSNGTEGEIFQEAWCYRCRKDSESRPCRILGATMAFNIGEKGYPREWVQDAEGEWPYNPRCTGFAEKGSEPARDPHHVFIRDRRQVGLPL